MQVVVPPTLPLTLDPPSSITQSISVFRRVAGSWITAAMIVNLAWVGFLGYGFFKLIEPCFSSPTAPKNGANFLVDVRRRIHTRCHARRASGRLGYFRRARRKNIS